MTRTNSSFNGGCWTVELPGEWTATTDQECATFQTKASSGALQVSSARKGGSFVTDEDVKEFMQDRVPSAAPISKVTSGRFSGYSASYSKDGRFWKEWWLRFRYLLIYATYNISLNERQSELKVVERIMDSIMPVERGEE